MPDAAAETVADRLEELGPILEKMGLPRETILEGYELATERLREWVAKGQR